jgi:hypothetical protein
MLRRWRQEIAQHETRGDRGRVRGYPHGALAPVPPQDCEIWEGMFRGGLCHCYAGMGFMRKRTAYGCGNPRCAVCHYEKFYVPKARANKQRAAINYELEAAG